MPVFYAVAENLNETKDLRINDESNQDDAILRIIFLVLTMNLHLRFRFVIFELQEMKLPVRLINTTNERRLVEGHETTPLRVKGDIEDISSEVDDGLERLHFLDETSRILVLSAS
ncbi:uncharacterized protein TNCV_2280481 [Trichonephila clavipes]|nr:uncharacterized protein TNCV_2280481 [Trichonephila clavipes]